MAEGDYEAMRDALLAQLEGEALEGEGMDGLALDDLREAMSHPEAMRTVAALLPLEASSVQPGDPAPDFTLPWLPGHGGEGEAMTLSSHFGRRPVALVFGSYT